MALLLYILPVPLKFESTNQHSEGGKAVLFTCVLIETLWIVVGSLFSSSIYEKGLNCQKPQQIVEHPHFTLKMESNLS